ncbi:MAG: hypothetical protein AB1449_09115 [Chloroflexota bacterium]
MTTLDRVLLLATGLAAIYILWGLASSYRQTTPKPHPALYSIVAFAVLLVAGLLLIAFGYGALQSPLVVIVAVLIPAGLSLGLVAQFLPRFEKAYLTFAALGLIAIAITRFTGPSWLATVVLVLVHSVAGVLILSIPIWAVAGKKAPSGFLGVSLGGALIDLGGVALAFLKAGSQLLFLSETVVFTILAPLLLLMTLAFAWGFASKAKSGAGR